MAIVKSDFAKGIRLFPQPAGSESISVRSEITLAAAIGSGDILQFGNLPDGCVVEDWSVDNDDVDTATGLAVDFGLLTAAGTAVSAAAADGGKWLTASTALQAAAVTRMSAQSVAVQTALARMNPATGYRQVGMVATGAGTGGVGGKIGVTIRYRAANGSN